MITSVHTVKQPEMSDPPNLPEDQRNLGILNTFIETGSCVLLLGPLFGLDAKGNKIHKELKAFLEGPENNVVVDDEFDNLYISKRSDGSENASLMAGITTFYRQLQGSPLYDRILKTGFQAIISFSSDLLLYQANSVSQEYEFFAFNRKGNENPESDGPRTMLKKPVIYNVYGDMRDMNAMIVDYDSLYDFLLNIMKADAEIPLQLKDILGKANAFLFLGFDLSRWYIPIIVRKLNQFIMNNRTRGIVNGFVCLDDTRLMNPDKISDSLNKYPLRFKAFRQFNTIELLAQLSTKSKNSASAAKPEENGLTGDQRNFFKEWNDNIIDLDRTTALDQFFSRYRKMSYKGPSKQELDGQSMAYQSTVMKKHQGVITDANFDVDCQAIVVNLQNITNNILQTHPGV